MFKKTDTVLDAILEEAQDMGTPKPVCALISKMYEDQQELRRCLEGLMHGKKWELERLEKRIGKIEDKLATPEEAAQKLKQAECCDTAAGMGCNLPSPGVIG